MSSEGEVVRPNICSVLLCFLLLCCSRLAVAQVASEVHLDTPSGRLAGTLQTPEGETRWPVALLIAGSGPTDRDGNSRFLAGKNNSLRLLAEGLAKMGVASLRYDKRGVGGSAGAKVIESELRFEHLVSDAEHWLEWLRADPRWSVTGNSPAFFPAHARCATLLPTQITHGSNSDGASKEGQEIEAQPG